MRDFLPVFAIAFGAAGLAACLFVVFLARRAAAAGADPGVIPDSELNRNIDIARYKPTPDPVLFLDKDLPRHPFKIGGGGVFCSTCLINTQLKRQTGPVFIHDHACTASGEEWKIVICRDGGRVEYFISLDHPHLRRGR